jgi:hypothetical protein
MRCICLGYQVALLFSFRNDFCLHTAETQQSSKELQELQAIKITKLESFRVTGALFHLYFHRTHRIGSSV